MLHAPRLGVLVQQGRCGLGHEVPFGAVRRLVVGIFEWEKETCVAVVWEGNGGGRLRVESGDDGDGGSHAFLQVIANESVSGFVLEGNGGSHCVEGESWIVLRHCLPHYLPYLGYEIALQILGPSHVLMCSIEHQNLIRD